MILTEKHSIKRKQKNKELYNKIDEYCYASKNLRNAVNYLITQCSRISFKLKQGEIIDSWEKKLIYDVNCGIRDYNNSRKGKPQLKYIDNTNGYIADAYFLSWYFKTEKEYKLMPYAVCSQLCIQNICRDWKSYYKGLQAYKTKKESMLGKPRKPGYYDKDTGRNWLILTNQTFYKDNNTNQLVLPKFLEGLYIKTEQEELRQLRIITRNDKIIIHVLYEVENIESEADRTDVMSIDLGVDNLATITSNTDMTPVIINGKPLKSINQYYNKRKADLQKKAMMFNGCYSTKRLCRLSEVRNNKVNDYLHKTSYKIIGLAIQNNIGTIIIGNNQGWKQNVSLGKRVNQNFVNIPYYQLIQQIIYKANWLGITVKVVDEKYTSGTSYLDDEAPTVQNYDKLRRITRGQFRSDTGMIINADVNGAYQIMKKCKDIDIPIKIGEKITKLKVA